MEIMMKDGPFKTTIEASQEGILRQEYITYRERDGLIMKETVSRKHTGDSYHDTTHIETIGKLSK